MTSPFAFDWVFDHASRSPQATALGAPGLAWVTYAELAAQVRTLAALLAEAGVGPDGFLVVTLPAGSLSVAAALAAQLLGAAVADVNRELGKDGLAEVLRQTAAKAALIPGRDAALWGPLARAATLDRLFVVHPVKPPDKLAALLDGVPWTWVPEAFPTSADSGPSPVRRADAPALLVYTSGSTGTPRAVIQTHANIDANTRAIARSLSLTAEDRALATLPLFYCYGRSVLQTHLWVGGSVFFDGRFMYPRVVMEEVAAQRCTGFAGVPLTFESLRRQVDLSTLDLRTLRYVTQAGGAMHPDTVRWARTAFAPAALYVMYGQTEATARLACLPPSHAEAKAGSAGRALDNVELRIVDDSGAPQPVNAPGNVVARGPSITPGYFQAPAETAEILKDGWLWTGDVGRLDEDGFLFLSGRTRDFLKLGGHRVSAVELEEALARQKGVSEVAVVGWKDDQGAEQAVAFVVKSTDAEVSAQALRRACREALPAFKVPKYICFTERLPRTASGKVAKAQLQESIQRDDTLLEGRAGAGPGEEGH